MTNERLDILINARNQASGALNQVKSELSGLSSAAETASGGLMGIAGALGGAAIAGLAIKMGAAVGDMARLAEASDRVRHAMEGLARGVGANADEMLAGLRKASGGAIADYELMLAANKAMMLGVADNTEELGKLMEVARTRGVAMGLSVGQAFDNLVTGLGRGSALILDNLGIMVDADATNKAYAASIGKTVSALTEQEKKQALVNRVMLEATGGAPAAASAYERMGAGVANLKVALGELAAPAIAAGIEALTARLEEAQKALEKPAPTRVDVNAAEADALRTRIADLEQVGQAEVLAAGYATRAARLKADAEHDYAKEALLAMDAVAAGQIVTAQAYDRGAQEAQVVTAAQAAYNVEMDRSGNTSLALAASLRVTLAAQQENTGAVADAEAAYRAGERSAAAFGATQGAIVPAINAVTQSLLDQAQAARDAIAETQKQMAGQVRNQLLGMAGDLGGQKALNLSIDLNKQLVERTSLMQQHGMTADQIEFQNAAWIDKQIGGLQDEISAQEKLAKATGSTHVATQALNAEYEKLAGTVQSVLQSSLDPGVGVNPDDLLPRQDGVNENARRVADIAVNGFKGQDWLEQFKNEVPDIVKALQEAADPKTAAAQLLKDFQDGLVPQLIDKDAAKEKVKRMITGEATMAQLATEIAQELSQEMGISLQQATQATNSALGAGGGTAALGDSGATASNAFGTGFDGAPVGGAFVDGLTTAIVERYAALETSGQSAGVTWRTGFLATTTVDIPTALVLALATLITPEVQKALDAQKGRSGAY